MHFWLKITPSLNFWAHSWTHSEKLHFLKNIRKQYRKSYYLPQYHELCGLGNKLGILHLLPGEVHKESFLETPLKTGGKVHTWDHCIQSSRPFPILPTAQVVHSCANAEYNSLRSWWMVQGEEVHILFLDIF